MRICLRLETIVMYFFLLKCEISCMLSTVFFTKRICLTCVRRNDDDDIKNFGGCVSNLLTELWTNSGPKFW